MTFYFFLRKGADSEVVKRRQLLSKIRTCNVRNSCWVVNLAMSLAAPAWGSGDQTHSRLVGVLGSSEAVSSAGQPGSIPGRHPWKSQDRGPALPRWHILLPTYSPANSVRGALGNKSQGRQQEALWHLSSHRLPAAAQATVMCTWGWWI